MSRYSIYLFIALFVVFVLIWQHVEFTRLSYREATLRQELHLLMNRNRDLRIEVARLKSPERIVRIAKKMGFVHANRVIVLEEVLNDD
jgi:cell division protein FtsL